VGPDYKTPPPQNPMGIFLSFVFLISVRNQSVIVPLSFHLVFIGRPVCPGTGYFFACFFVRSSGNGISVSPE